MAVTSPREPKAEAIAGPSGSGSAGRRRAWWRAYRHHLRVLRAAGIAWTVVLAGIGAGVVATFEDRLPTEAERAAAQALEGVPAFEALFGRFVEPGSLEGFVLARWGMFAIVVAVWGLIAATRLLRGAEEAGHVEPLRAGVLAPRGLLAAAIAALLTWFAAFAVVVGGAHAAAGMDAATGWTLGAAMGLLATTFAAVGVVASQLAATRRRTIHLAGIVLGLALVVRVLAAGTATPDWVWWATPFGWTGFLHEADQARPTVFAAFGATIVVLLAAALVLAARDLHAGVVGGGEVAGRRVRPVGGHVHLTARLTGAAVLVWGIVLAGGALLFSLLAHDFTEVMVDLDEGVEIYEQMGYTGLDTVEGFLGLTLGWFFLVGVALFAAAQVAAIRDEEATWRVEHLLVRPVGRVRWLATRVAAAALGLVVIALAVAGGVWLGTALGGGAIAVGDALLAGLNLLPAALLFLGLGVLVVGLVPRRTAPLAYGLVLAAFLLDFVGPLLELPDRVLAVSPFHHLAAVPVEDPGITAAVVMLLIGIVSGALGMAAFRRRDLQEA